MSTINVNPAPYAGIYLLTEAASYLLAGLPHTRRRPTSRRIHWWIKTGLIAPHLGEMHGRERVIDFADLISCQAITSFQAKGIPLQRIRKAEQYFRDLYDVDKPFAHRAFWYCPPDIFTKLDDGIIVAGTRGGQLALSILEEWLTHLRVGIAFSDKDQYGKAMIWYPQPGISLRPNVQFGQPCIRGTRIPTSAIWSYVNAGDPSSYIASAYDLKVEEVEQAVAWENRLRSLVAAPSRQPLPA